MHVYWTTRCADCPLKSRCTSSNQPRRIKRWEHEAVIDAMQDRLDRRPDAMRVRRATVEHAFGTLKAWMGATHFKTRTLHRVRTSARCAPSDAEPRLTLVRSGFWTRRAPFVVPSSLAARPWPTPFHRGGARTTEWQLSTHWRHWSLATAESPELVKSRCGAVAVGRTYLFAAPFVWRCLSGSTVAPFPHPAHRTGRADFPHPALGQDLTPSFACNAICSFWTLFGVDRLPNLQVPHHVVRLS